MRISLCTLALGTAITAGSLSIAKVPHVEIVPTEDGGFQLLRDGAPYFIKGAGGSSDLGRLAEIGANSIRTWGSDQWDTALEHASAHGLTVLAGLWMVQERQGFDYQDAAAVAAQEQAHKEAVLAHLDRPEILMWSIGNEVEIEGTDLAVWDSIERLAAWIKSVDPHRPVMTVTAYPAAETLQAIRTRAPSIDILGINAYAPIARLDEQLARHWGGPYIVAEWGPNGQWEVDKTPWGAVMEPSSTEKAQDYRKRHRFIAQSPRCLGGYAFYWGQKTEATLTWFGVKLEDGRELDSLEALREIWSGTPADPGTPAIRSIHLDQLVASDGPVFNTRQSIAAAVHVDNPQSVRSVQWELTHDEHRPPAGGDPEPRPITELLRDTGTTLGLTLPSLQSGMFRLYVYVEGASGRVATANIPFLIQPACLESTQPRELRLPDPNFK